MAGFKDGLSNLAQSLKTAWSGVGYQPPVWASKTWVGNRADYSDAISLYQGDQEGILIRDIRDAFHQNNAAGLIKQPIVFPILERIVNKRAMLYKAWPTFEGDKALVDLMEERLGGQFKQADRLSELCGLAWVGPQWDSEEKRLEIIVITADMAEPIWNPLDTGELIALRLYTMTTNSNSRPVIVVTEWREDSFSVRVDGKDATKDVASEMGMGPSFEAGENPYGCIPFVPMRPRTPLLGDNQGVPLLALVRMQRTLNMKMTELSALIRAQAFSQLVSIGNTPPTDVVMGMFSVLHLREEIAGQGDLKYLTPTAAIGELWLVIKELIQHMAFLYCDGGQWGASGTAPSGAALKVNNADLEEYRRDKQDSHQQFIHEFGEVCGAVLSVSANGPKTTGELSVTKWGAVEIYQDPIIIAQEWELRIAGGVASRTAWAIEEHPEMDEAKAKAFIAKVMAEEKAFRAAGSIPPASDFLSRSQKVPVAGEPPPGSEDMAPAQGAPASGTPAKGGTPQQGMNQGMMGKGKPGA